MTEAESLRIVCALAQVPGTSPSVLAASFARGAGLSIAIENLPHHSDADLGQLLTWDSTQMRFFRQQLGAPLERFKAIADRGIRVISALEAPRMGWPMRLPSTPWLFYRGDIAILNQPAVGFSGSRDASAAALEIARNLASAASHQQMTVVSGGARGVDLAAHAAALAAGGTTVVLPPQGVDTWWVPMPLADPQMRGRLLVISTDVPWAPWSTISAMQRNRAIVDLSDVIAIPHAGVTGGSHSTGVYALGQKRDLWVADLDKDAPGNSLLLNRGAKAILFVGGVPDLATMRTSKAAFPAQQSLF